MKITDKYVFFWKEHPFCNFTRCEIRTDDYGLDDKTVFTSSEQLFMWYKAMFFDDEETAEKILKTNDPETARRLGRTVKNYDDKKWDMERTECMYDAVWMKFVQNEDLRKKLCDPKYDGKHFVEAAYYDRIWGIGYNENDALDNEDNWGRNELGKILDEVRRRLMLKSAGVYRDIQE